MKRPDRRRPFPSRPADPPPIRPIAPEHLERVSGGGDGRDDTPMDIHYER